MNDIFGLTSEELQKALQPCSLPKYRARQIANEAEENGEILDKKPVAMAIDEVYSGKLTLEKTDD